jgi:hypothetical protein
MLTFPGGWRNRTKLRVFFIHDHLADAGKGCEVCKLWGSMEPDGRGDRRMTGGAKAIKASIVAAAIISLLTLPAYAQSHGKKGGAGGSPAENRPKVDEKAYKAALDRIPTPKKGYDPWGQVRPAEPAKTTNKPNQ